MFIIQSKKLYDVNKELSDIEARLERDKLGPFLFLFLSLCIGFSGRVPCAGLL